MEKAKGSSFLKVTGILMIIGGGISIIMSIAAVIGVAAILSLGGVGAGILVFACILALAGSAIELVTGIVGVVNCKKPEKATVCLVWGSVVAVLNVVSSILSASAGNGFNVSSLILGLVLPVLFIIGAALNKQQA